jgi:hypothetical protein
MNAREGAASSCASFRSATFLILANRGQRPVVKSAWVSAQAKDWIAIEWMVPVIRLTIN